LKESTLFFLARFQTERMNQQIVNAFSIRQLSPFRGVLQVFLNNTARALSGNGQVWEIQVLSDRPQGLWANTPFSGRQFYTFGLWTIEGGLRQVPINPLFNIQDMITSAQALIEQLQPQLAQLPFPLADPYEAWLLDEKESRPLALLQSSRSEEERHKVELGKWISAQRGDFSFVSEHLLMRGLPSNDGHNPRVHAAFIEAVVRERAGQHRRSVWYYRHGDGSASPCDESDSRLPASQFPELPISEQWTSDEDSGLIADYIRWKAPQLLLLPYLSQATRERLERLAVDQAEAVDRLWRLYPQIHNQALLNRARVEARIRTANRTQ
jgi:hypothetical protein